jgi:hypothetical protein
MAIAYTSLMHSSLQIQIATAIRKAVNMSFQNQRAGQAALKSGIVVHHSRHSGGLRFFDKNGNNITSQMRKALRMY